jgi:hypothetical protein
MGYAESDLEAVAAAMLSDLRASQAYYGNGPWCAVESVGFGTVTEDCSMRTFEHCRMQTIAGNRGFAKQEEVYDYSRARNLMLKETDTRVAPWYIVR